MLTNQTAAFINFRRRFQDNSLRVVQQLLSMELIGMLKFTFPRLSTTYDLILTITHAGTVDLFKAGAAKFNFAPFVIDNR